jgi:hypothetical protein
MTLSTQTVPGVILHFARGASSLEPALSGRSESNGRLGMTALDQQSYGTDDRV